MAGYDTGGLFKERKVQDPADGFIINTQYKGLNHQVAVKGYGAGCRYLFFFFFLPDEVPAGFAAFFCGAASFLTSGSCFLSGAGACAAAFAASPSLSTASAGLSFSRL